jgi:glutaredoxin
MNAAAPPRVTVITRENCHLCDVAKDAVQRLAGELGVTWAEADVDADPALLDEYSDLVPVILVDGRMHGYWRVEEDRLRQALLAP